MFQRMMNTIARFMQGRYGNDRFNRFLFILYFRVCHTKINNQFIIRKSYHFFSKPDLTNKKINAIDNPREEIF